DANAGCLRSLDGIVPAVEFVPAFDRAVLEQTGGLLRRIPGLLRELARRPGAGERAFGKRLRGEVRMDDDGAITAVAGDDEPAFRFLEARSQPFADHLDGKHQLPAKLEELVARPRRFAKHQPGSALADNSAMNDAHTLVDKTNRQLALLSTSDPAQV